MGAASASDPSSSWGGTEAKYDARGGQPGPFASGQDPLGCHLQAELPRARLSLPQLPSLPCWFLLRALPTHPLLLKPHLRVCFGNLPLDTLCPRATSFPVSFHPDSPSLPLLRLALPPRPSPRVSAPLCPLRVLRPPKASPTDPLQSVFWPPHRPPVPHTLRHLSSQQGLAWKDSNKCCGANAWYVWDWTQGPGFELLQTSGLCEGHGSRE